MKIRWKAKGTRTTRVYCAECMDEPLEFSAKGEATVSASAWAKIEAHHPDAFVEVKSPKKAKSDASDG